MTTERFYSVELKVKVPLDHQFPEEVRHEVYLQTNGDTTVSELLAEEIVQLLAKSGLQVYDIGSAMCLWTVADEFGNTITNE